MENQHGLVVAGRVTLATGTAERRALETMLKAKAEDASLKARRNGVRIQQGYTELMTRARRGPASACKTEAQLAVGTRSA
jgi:hypothetical protein